MKCWSSGDESSMRVLTAIPVYNEQTYLEPVLTEVLRHAGDVLVVDDGSTDRTPELLRGFPTVQVDVNGMNHLGISSNRSRITACIGLRGDWSQSWRMGRPTRSGLSNELPSAVDQRLA